MCAARDDIAVGILVLPRLGTHQLVTHLAATQMKAHERPLRSARRVLLGRAARTCRTRRTLGVRKQRLGHVWMQHICVVPVRVLKRRLVHKVEYGANRPVRQRTVQVLDEHHLRALLEVDMTWRHKVFKHALALVRRQGSTIQTGIRACLGIQRVEALLVGTLHVATEGIQLCGRDAFRQHWDAVQLRKRTHRLGRQLAKAHLVEHANEAVVFLPEYLC